MTSDNTAAASGTFDLGGDLPVVRLGFGAMRLTGQGIWGEPDDRDEALRVVRRALELGITFIDTADSYGPYVSEEIIKEAIHPYPDDVVVATKAGLVRGGPNGLLSLAGPPGAPPIAGSGASSDPLPQALILTAIVITFAVSAFLMALVYRSWRLAQEDHVERDAADVAVGQGDAPEPEEASADEESEFDRPGADR